MSGDYTFQTQVFPGLNHKLHQIEEVRRTTAGHRSDGVNQPFVINPEDLSNRPQNLLCPFVFAPIDLIVCK